MILGTRNLNDLVTLNTNQVLTGNVTINGNVVLTNHSDTVIEQLFMQKRIFNVNLIDVLTDSVHVDLTQPIFLKSNKRFSNITVEQFVANNNFWKLKKTEVIDEVLKDRRNGVFLNGDVILRAGYEIGDVTVTDFINGIESNRFGKEWLLIEGDQVNAA